MKSLRTWFTIHFIVDYIIAIPLFLHPEKVLSIFNIAADPLLGRLLAAALFAIGGISAFKHTKKEYKALLNLKIIWAGFAILALIIALISTQNILLVPFLLLFLVFQAVWVYYKTLLN
tara:strand:- start:1969 stop:2322 length:354 start_codon:yes stop_codon:yes gene_type:complete